MLRHNLNTQHRPGSRRRQGTLSQQSGRLEVSAGVSCGDMPRRSVAPQPTNLSRADWRLARVPTPPAPRCARPAGRRCGPQTTTLRRREPADTRQWHGEVLRRMAANTETQTSAGTRQAPAGQANHVDLSPLAYLERAARAFGERVALIDGSTRWTYRQLRERVHRQATALRGIGIGSGDRVAVLAPNSPMLLEAHFGVPLAGGVLVPINTRLAAAEIRYILQHAGARALLLDAELEATVAPALADCPDLQGLIVAGGGGGGAPGAPRRRLRGGPTDFPLRRRGSAGGGGGRRPPRLHPGEGGPAAGVGSDRAR